MRTVQKIMRASLSVWAALVAVAVAQVTAPSAGMAEDFTIGVISPMTGVGADLGIASQQAVEPVIEEINRAGGMNGMQIKVIFRDDESNPAEGRGRCIRTPAALSRQYHHGRQPHQRGVCRGSDREPGQGAVHCHGNGRASDRSAEISLLF